MKIPKLAKDIAQMLAIFAVVYFGNQQIQTYLGKKAVAETGLVSPTFEQALQMAQQQGKPIVAEFSAIWCGSCRKFDQNVLSDEQVKAKLGENYVFTRLEYESDDRQFFERYGVRGFPTVLMISADGGTARRLALSFDAKQFASQL